MKFLPVDKWESFDFSVDMCITSVDIFSYVLKHSKCVDKPYWNITLFIKLFSRGDWDGIHVIKGKMNTIADRVEAIGGEVKYLLIEEPASIEKIEQMEKRLGVKLPSSFRKVLMEFSENVTFYWYLPDENTMPEEFSGIFSGNLDWALNTLPVCEEGRLGWIEHVFPNPDDPYDAVWHDKLAFCDVGNGDMLAFDLREADDDAAIVYLSHEGDTSHGYKLADNFIDLLEKWSKVAFVGAEDWQWMKFTKDKQSGIEPNGEPAKRFRSWLGID